MAGGQGRAATFGPPRGRRNPCRPGGRRAGQPPAGDDPALSQQPHRPGAAFYDQPAFLKQYTVFNVAQCDGLPEALTAPPPRQDLIAPRFQALMAGSGMTIRFGGDIACYRPAEDVIVCPPPEAFHDPVNVHRTLAHEMSHCVGHASRLARDLTGRYGSEGYAREELVAEISAAYVCASLGIVPSVRHADYIASWLDVLRGDPRAIVQAASLASRSADWLLDRLPAEYALTADAPETVGEPEREAA